MTRIISSIVMMSGQKMVSDLLSYENLNTTVLLLLYNRILNA